MKYIFCVIKSFIRHCTLFVTRLDQGGEVTMLFLNFLSAM